jgi:histidine ammonia-lyase
LAIDDALASLVAASRRYLAAVAGHPPLPDIAGLPTTQSLRAPSPVLLPVLRWLPVAVAAAPPACAPLAQALAAAAPRLAWRQTYAVGEMPAEFLDNYGWTEIVGAGGLLASDTLVCGFLLLGPRTLYPSHAHAAEEFYWPLSGTAAWRRAGGAWRRRPAGVSIHHRSHVPHAMRTFDDALLAFYLWRGAGLDQPARLTDARAP